MRLVALASTDDNPQNIKAVRETNEPAAEIVLIKATAMPAIKRMNR